MRIALKVDVKTPKGASEGVPGLLRLFEQYEIKASFFFNVGPVTDGTPVQRVWSRARGLLKRAPDEHDGSIADSMLSVIESGHEIGLQAFDPVSWEKSAAFADADWTRHQLALAAESFEKIVGCMPTVGAAAGWQLNSHLLALEEKLGFAFASDTRGKYPFYPLLHNVRSHCPQIPTTLPTLREMLARDNVETDRVHEYLYTESRYVLPAGHVYTVRAEDEGMLYLDIMEKLIVMWKGQEGSLRSLGDIYKELDLETLPIHQVGWAAVPGEKRHLATQSLQAAI